MLTRRDHVIGKVTVAAVLIGGAALVAPAAATAEPASTERGTAADGLQPGDLTREGESVLVDMDQKAIAPGMELTTFSRLEQDGWNAGSVLEVDLSAGVTLDYQYSGTVTERKTVGSMAEDSGATAAINGDFFDINESDAPLGVGVSRDEGLVTTPVAGHDNAFTVSEDGSVRMARVFLEGEIAVGDGTTLDLAGVNTFRIPAGGIGVYTSAWGDYTRADAVQGAATTAEVVVVDGEVTEVGATPGAGSIADDAVVLVGRGAGAESLLGLEKGQTVDVTYAPRSDFGEVAVALGGNQVLMSDGEPRDFGSRAQHPRSALGISADGSRMYMVTIDGRQAHAHGMTLTETAEFMDDIGAYDALNIDGGGSSTMVVRDPATDDRSVVNSPSDGSQRPVANGLGLFATEGSGELSGFRVRTESDSEHAGRVFPGLTRSIDALGHDESLAPVEARPRWHTSDHRVARVSRDADAATVTGVAPGQADISARLRGSTGELGITVLGELRRIEPNETLVALGGADDTGRIELTGYDIDGYRAPIEPADVDVSGGGDVVDLVTDGDGLRVRPLRDSGSALLTLSAGGVETKVAVTIGLEEVSVADFSDAADWDIAFARATGAIEPTEGPDGRDGVRMSYDFTGPNTRAAYAKPPQQFELPGQPQSVNAWVRGDGNGTWIRMRVYDRNGTLLTLNGGYTTFTGWRKVEFAVPAGTEYPLTFRDVYAVEPRGDARYEGETAFSDITVEVAPDVQLPETERFEDPVIVTDGTADGAQQRIAVMSDSQFVGRDPDSDVVAAARRTLREIVAAQPDALVINGDFVDEAAPEDFDLARRILDEELAGVDFPWYYVPGNHEVQGGPISNFTDEFGPTQRTVDLPGSGGTTRIITLSSAFGTLRAGGDEFDQIAQLRSDLNEAAADPSISGVLVFAHHPTDDPLPTANSQLVDRREADMVERWLAEFEAGSGKSAAYVGAHVGVFDATSVDGVPYVINGNSGKTPSSTADNGGFTGWTMLGVEPPHGRGESGSWLTAEVHARVDAIELTAPAELAVDGSGDVAATVAQDDTRVVPVDWPVSAQWGGDRVFVGPAADAPADAVVAVDPDAGTVVGLRAGTASLSVTVNGETATKDITVS
ncbi:calcineurin-like phosphoesterase family protein [Haloactinopolyspora alba]|uniref:Calcineurin-like phosphoesterase family protein n=1 Tax=Haloactinopolyspora alba TaxID=648780 RepID=A0A2P8E5D8_9ACTN|nr:phosphodiester glycosidase family protein [Haloactinopolyspora alba]PSL04662.1 calcineurin-like phosphoesterase family protein [Haloactinopolyspora alba]